MKVFEGEVLSKSEVANIQPAYGLDPACGGGHHGY